MSDVISVRPLPLLARPDVLDAKGLRLPPGLAYDEWASVVGQLLQMREGVQWAVGDALLYGEWHYGEDASQLLDFSAAGRDRLTYDDKSLLNMRRVAEVFPYSRRRECSWSHHAEVAGLEPEAQEHWLDRAAAGLWSVRELRRELRPRSEEVRELHGALNGLREQHGSEVLTPELLTRAVERELRTQEAALLAAASAPREPARDRAVALIGVDAVRTLEDAQLTVIWRGSR